MGKKILKQMKKRSLSMGYWDQQLNWAINNAKGKNKEAQIFKKVYTEIIQVI